MACDFTQVISGSEYDDVQSDMAAAKRSLDLMSSFVYSAVQSIAYMQVVLPEVDLLKPFWDSYEAVVQLQNSPSVLLPAVRALQAHVLTRCPSYTTIDGYIAGEVPGGKVCTEWKQLSDAAGYPIGSGYTQVCS